MRLHHCCALAGVARHKSESRGHTQPVLTYWTLYLVCTSQPALDELFCVRPPKLTLFRPSNVGPRSNKNFGRIHMISRCTTLSQPVQHRTLPVNTETHGKNWQKVLDDLHKNKHLFLDSDLDNYNTGYATCARAFVAPRTTKRVWVSILQTWELTSLKVNKWI